ncbi:alpha/beta hydrolase family protein [Solimonas marina]|uniref:Alpha/beta fold hydrolase n=1 Tax=Solimonas marina TaxID=2714601 RepID=A0A970B4V6_9GAMM|nr:alpha/beta fold hydrolase [Solimonas marina]NKF21038.1 alpha/beta fold hydrolase [Solimonas marina]
MSTEATLEFAAADGYRLSGSLQTPVAPPRAAIVIHPATGVPERLYLPLARFLAAHGHAVLTYDYRGIGRSAPPSLRGFDARMRDWMEQDVAGATRVLSARFPGVPLLAIGHSVGGHALGISEASDSLQAAALIASHAGYIGSIRGWGERMRVRAMLMQFGPLLVRACGYLPWRRLGLGEDLPAGVAREWIAWCRSPGYFFDDPTLRAQERFAARRLPLLVLGFTDDPWANPRAIGALVRHFTHCAIERREIAPADVGAPAIGHMGFFRQRFSDTLWPQLLAWLDAQLQVAPLPARSAAAT